MATLKELREAANKWAAQEKADIESGAKKPPMTSKEKIMAEKPKSEYTDFSNQKHFRSNPPAAAESRTKANKPLKTALVREVEPGRNRGRLAAQTREARKNYPGEQLQSNQDAKLDRLQSAAETGEAQAFVGQMKPGVGARTAAHTLQSREFNYPPQNQSKDLGRAVTNTIRREQAPGLLGSFTEPPGGSLMKLAKTRAAQGRSIAGPDAPAVPENRRGMYKGKPAGVAPTVTLNSRAKGWDKIKAIEPGELPDTD